MSFSFENQGANTYLVYEIGENDQEDSMSLGMLTNNTIPGLAAASFTQVDNSKFVKFNVTAKVSVSQLFSGPVNKKRLIGVFSGIVDAMISAEEYMLDHNSMLLDLDYIFADVTTCETVMICLPIVNREQKNEDLGVFFKNIIFHTQFDQTENCDHVAKILNYLNGSPALALKDFKKLLDSIGDEKTAAASRPQPVAAAQPRAAAAPTSQPAVQPTIPGPMGQPKAQQPVPQNPAVPQNATNPTEKKSALAPGEKPMSMMYLLQHYNKENAAKYKSQQNAKKAEAAASKDKKKSKPAKEPKAAKASKRQTTAPGFKVPGAPDTGFAVPGQAPQTPKATPGGFAVPGQAAPAPMAASGGSAPRVQPAAPVATQPQTVPASPISFGETTVLGGDIGETTVLGASGMNIKPEPHLIRQKNNEKIPLDKPVFRIGKERSYVDYFVSDNTAISRSHANIIDRDGTYYIVDTNSTNHTYVDGKMINPNEEVKLNDGARIRLANEEFSFRMI